MTSTETTTSPASESPASSPRRAAAVAAGGAVGASGRYLLLELFPPEPGSFPLTVFAENIVGAFALGLVATLLAERWKPSWDVRAFVCTGVLGSFTTFSNVSLDVYSLSVGGALTIALAYAAASLVFGLAASFTGIRLARRLARSGPR